MRSLMMTSVASVLSLFAAITEVRAQEVDPAADTPASTAQPAGADEPSRDGGWEFSATAYLWAAGLEGEVGVFPALPTVDVDLSFGDVLENLDFAAMALVQARKGRFVALADVSYVDLGASRDLTVLDPLVLTAELDTSMLIATVAAGYRAVDQETISLDAIGGARVTSVDTRLALSRLNLAVARERSETWIDPVVGARLRAPLASRWTLAVYGDVGGFGVSSDLTWQILGAAHYRIGRQASLALGWRHYAVDYENDGFVYDVSLSGPVIGFTLGF